MLLIITAPLTTHTDVCGTGATNIFSNYRLSSKLTDHLVINSVIRLVEIKAMVFWSIFLLQFIMMYRIHECGDLYSGTDDMDYHETLKKDNPNVSRL